MDGFRRARAVASVDLRTFRPGGGNTNRLRISSRATGTLGCVSVALDAGGGADWARVARFVLLIVLSERLARGSHLGRTEWMTGRP
jgi:hypothetical protein